MADKDTMAEAINNYLVKLENIMKPLVFVKDVVLQPTYSTSYDLQNLLDAEASKYDLLSTRVEVLVLDQEPGSQTEDMYLDASAVVTVAIKSNGLISITNKHTSSVNLLIKIFRPLVLK